MTRKKLLRQINISINLGALYPLVLLLSSIGIVCGIYAGYDTLFLSGFQFGWALSWLHSAWLDRRALKQAQKSQFEISTVLSEEQFQSMLQGHATLSVAGHIGPNGNPVIDQIYLTSTEEEKNRVLQ